MAEFWKGDARAPVAAGELEVGFAHKPGLIDGKPGASLRVRIEDTARGDPRWLMLAVTEAELDRVVEYRAKQLEYQQARDDEFDARWNARMNP